MQRRLPSAAALAVAAFSVHTAQAAISGPEAVSTIYWPSFNVSIVDLDLGDGIDPSFTFANQTGYVEAYSQSPSDSQWVYNPVAAGNWTTWLSSSASTTHAEAAALSNSVIHLASAAAEQVAGLCGGLPCSAPNQNNRAAAYTYNDANFTLTGAAKAVVSIDWSIAVTDATPLETLDFAFASIYVGGNYQLSDNSNGDFISDYRWIDTTVHLPETRNGNAMLTVINPTNLTTADGYLRLETYSNAEGYINPVPEPETWVMLLAGIGLVGAIARRRARG